MLDDMISEMTVATEATRYAKEMHKKAEKSLTDAEKYEAIGKNTKSKAVRNAMIEKEQKAINNHIDAEKRDSIATGKCKDRKNGYERAAKQPGRYEKEEKRKPGTYKEIYDKYYKNKK